MKSTRRENSPAQSQRNSWRQRLLNKIFALVELTPLSATTVSYQRENWQRPLVFPENICDWASICF
jgi:hypothetical protein